MMFFLGFLVGGLIGVVVMGALAAAGSAERASARSSFGRGRHPLQGPVPGTWGPSGRSGTLGTQRDRI